MKKISIVIILPSLAAGGAEKVTLNFLENLDNKIYDIYLIFLNTNGPLKLRTKKNVFDLKSVRLRNAFPKLINKIRIIKPDIIFSTFPHITLPLLLMRKFLFRNSKIISREPNMTDNSFRHSSFSLTLKILHKLLLPEADKIIVNSKAMYKDLVNKGIETNKIKLIQNPVDHLNIRKIKHFIRFPGQGLRLVAMGRLVYQKGFDRVLPIIRNVRNAHLTILGEGPEYENLLSMVSNLDIEEQIKFVGYKDNPYSYLAAADYFILPSRWEGLPNSALESLVLGTPVISFNEIEGLLDLFPNVEGNQLYLCKNNKEMISLLNKLSVRSDSDNLILRNSLLSNFNSPENYSLKISKIINELVCE